MAFQSTTRPEIWKRVVVVEDQSNHKTTKSGKDNSSFIKSGKRPSKISTKVLRSLNNNNSTDYKKKTSKKKKKNTNRTKSVSIPDMKKTETKGKIIIGPRLQQRVQSEKNNSKKKELISEEVVTTNSSDTIDTTTEINYTNEEDAILNRLRLEEGNNEVVNVDSRKIFSLTDVNLPTPVRTRLVKCRPSSSPSTRQNISSHGSGMSAAKSLRPVSSNTLETALPKNTDTTNLNSWFSKLETAEQKAASSQDEQRRMSLQVGEWETKYKTLEKEVRSREADHHDRILILQQEILQLKNENTDLKNDVNHLHEARREVSK
jgi:hypothetical protein